MLIPEVLARLHEGYQGITKCQLCASICAYWPGIMDDIECIARQCAQCLPRTQLQCKISQNAPLVPQEVPQQPWEVIRTDFFIINVNFLLVAIFCPLFAHYFFKVPFVGWIRRFTSTSVIGLMKHIFRDQGMPRKVFSDNGQQYVAADFKEFARNTWRQDLDIPKESKVMALQKEWIKTLRKSPKPESHTLTQT